MRNRLPAYILGMFLVSAPALGAEFSYIDYEPFTNQKLPGSSGYLLLSGEIVPGDYDRLLNKIIDDEHRFLVQNTIVLASNGGDVAEAVKIAKLIKSLYSTVYVGPLTGPCVSACFLIYAAANDRASDDEHLIGIHRPYVINAQLASLSATDAEKTQNQVLKQAREYLQDNNVPAYLIEEMFRRSSNDVFWLSANDLAQLGYRSPWFDQYLVAKCNWKGKTPVDVESREASWCRLSFTIPAAHKALVQAFNEPFDRARKMLEGVPRCHKKGTVDPKTEECPD